MLIQSNWTINTYIKHYLKIKHHLNWTELGMSIYAMYTRLVELQQLKKFFIWKLKMVISMTSTLYQ